MNITGLVLATIKSLTKVLRKIVDLIGVSKHSVKPLPLPTEIVEYLLIVCDQLKVTMASLQLTLSVACRYLKAKPNNLPLQLILMASLMICCKFIETNPPELSTFHKYSSNSFTSRGTSLIVRFLSNRDVDPQRNSVRYHCRGNS